MNTRPRVGLALVAGLLLVATSGCGRSGAGVAKSPEQAKEAIKQAFAGAPSDVKTLAGDIEAAMKANEDAKAFLQLGNLTARPDLTAEQRGAAAQAMLTVNQKLSAAAANGDRDAAALLDSYRASK
ncbi:MAG: hypothetical protein WCP53_07550 [Verrucomicrobiota bacterium]